MKISVAYNCDNEYDIDVLDIAICDVLRELGHEVDRFPVSSFDCLYERLNTINADLVFNSFDGFDDDPESELFFSSNLEKSGRPFTGNSFDALSLTLDKYKTQNSLSAGGIKVPNSFLIGRESAKVKEFPYILKPNRDDCSNLIDIKSVVYDVSQFAERVKYLREAGCHDILAEQYIKGREFTSTVVRLEDNMIILGISEIKFDSPSYLPNIRTFESKQRDCSYYRNPVLDARDNEKIRGMSISSCNITGCTDYTRVDFRRDENGEFYVLEINANPDLSFDSSTFYHTKQTGRAFRDLIEIIVLSAADKFNLRRGKDAKCNCNITY